MAQSFTRTWRLALAAWVATATVALAGCAGPPPNNPPRPLSGVDVDGIVYPVRSARVLNPDDPEDRVFLAGRRPSPGRAGGELVALFELPEDAGPRRPLDLGVESVDGSVGRVRVVDVGDWPSPRYGARPVIATGTPKP